MTTALVVLFVVLIPAAASLAVLAALPALM